MKNINILKPNKDNFRTYLFIGITLVFLGVFDVFLRSFFMVNCLSFLPNLLNL